MTITRDENRYKIEMKKGLLLIFNAIRKNVLTLTESDLIPIVDKTVDQLFILFGEFEKAIEPEMEEMQGKIYGVCSTCGRALKPYNPFEK